MADKGRGRPPRGEGLTGSAKKKNIEKSRQKYSVNKKKVVFYLAPDYMEQFENLKSVLELPSNTDVITHLMDL